MVGAAAVDELTGQRFEIRARAVVNAGGVWADRVRGLAASGPDRLVPSKGVHLVFAPGTVRTKVGLIIPSGANDGRYVFVIPWEDRVYAGTTDTSTRVTWRTPTQPAPTGTTSCRRWPITSPA